jgi:hypothetical protein
MAQWKQRIYRGFIDIPFYMHSGSILMPLGLKF